MFKFKKGFTLIELLVVIAVLGVLATVVIVAINPLQQLAKARDTGRLNSVDQMGNALVALGTSNASSATPYPTAATWSTALIGELGTTSLPVAVPYSSGGGTACTKADAVNGWCYIVNAGQTAAIIYTGAEATSNTSHCSGANVVAWYVYSTVDGRAGGVCSKEASLTTGAQTYAF